MHKLLKLTLTTSLVLLLTGVSIYFFWQYNLLRKANEKLAAEKSAKQPREMSLNDFYLYTQKTKALEAVMESTVYYAARVEKISNSQVRVDFYLLGGEKMKIDAADLSFDLDQNLKLERIYKGDTFENYPRVYKEKQRGVITGVASIAGNKVLLGSANQIFATAIVSKLNPRLNSQLTIDLENTKAYLEGEPVLSQAATIKEIEF